MRSARGNLRHAMRVAGTATAVVALVYLVVVVVFDVVVFHRLLAQVDSRLATGLTEAAHHPSGLASGIPRPEQPSIETPPSADHDDAPVFLWAVGPSGRVTANTAGAPSLRAGSWAHGGGFSTSTLGSSAFRLDAAPLRPGWVVAGVSIANQQRLQSLVVIAEVVAGPIALLGMFLGSLVIGLKASDPVERARLRQLEFTADASHELRTPLSVIEAEVDLALRAARPAESYRRSLVRVQEESGRLKHIVEDLLWLARFDARPPPPASEPIDLATIAELCVARFQPLARSRRIDIAKEVHGDDPPWVNAPAEWIDRLASVLVDNACRYSPPGGGVLVVVSARQGRVSLRVEDSGTGIPADERSRLFDRFHRATDAPGGTGLGLAIADSIVRSTDGRWRIGDSTLGGALMEVTWHRSTDRGRDAPSRTDLDAVSGSGGPTTDLPVPPTTGPAVSRGPGW